MSEAPEVNVEVITPESAAEVAKDVTEQAADILDTALEIAEVIDEARKDGERDDAHSLIILERLDDVLRRIDEVSGRLDQINDELATLTAIEVAEIVVENDPDEISEIADVAEVIAEPEPVPEAVSPQTRKEKNRRWID